MTPIPPDQLVQLGLAGVVLAWFMFRADRLLDALTKAVEQNTHAVMLLAERIGPGRREEPEPIVEPRRTRRREAPAES